MNIHLVISIIFMSLASAVEASATTTKLHRRAGQVIVPACIRVNNETDNFGYSLIGLNKRDINSSPLGGLMLVTRQLMEAQSAGAEAVYAGQKQVSAGEAHEVMSLRHEHKNKIDKFTLAMLQLQNFEWLHKTRKESWLREVADLLELQMFHHAGFSKVVISKMPAESREHLEKWLALTIKDFQDGITLYNPTHQIMDFQKFDYEIWLGVKDIPPGSPSVHILPYHTMFSNFFGSKGKRYREHLISISQLN
jgi:hypothetical protein